MNTTTHNLGTVEQIDPQALVIEANVRTSAPVTPEFVRSIRENGVLTPVLARRDENGNVLVRAGQRRTLASREAGLSAIPVYVVDADETTAERIIQQLVENDQREALTGSDRIAAFQQLAFEGMPVATIARRLGTKTKEVKTALTVAENPTAASAVAEHPITLDQAATLIEFEDDPDTTAALIKTATTEPAQFAHAVQRARDERTRARIKAESVADLTARGYEILDQSYFHEGPITNIRDLRTAEGERVTVEQVEQIEGRAAHVTVHHGHDEASITYFVTNPKAVGLRKEGGAASGPMTDEQKAERRELIANNKAWASAETVRREWLTAFLARKTLPKDAAAFVATALTTVHSTVGHAVQNGNGLAHDLLGIQRGSYGRDNLAPLVERTPAKAAHVALAIVLGGIEDSTGKHTWRNPVERDALYFRRLAAWGYTLSEVEQIIVDTIDVKATIDYTDKEYNMSEVDTFDQVDGED